MAISALSCETIVTEYLSNLKDSFEVVAGNHKCILVTPFTRPDGDFIEIEAEPMPDGSLRLSDMGESLAYLYLNGMTLGRNVVDDAKRICRTNGIELVSSEMAASVTSQSDVGETLQRLIQSSLLVSDFIQRRRFSERSQFSSVVESFLVGNRATYERDVPILGKSGSEHLVKFQVGGNILIQPLMAASTGGAWAWAERWAFRFGDILGSDQHWHTFAVLDDRGDRVAVWEQRSVFALQTSANVVPWSQSDRLVSALQVA